jgi:sec-independent protein translocase protein TatA
MPNIGTPELIIIVVILLLLFGGSKLPQLARALGQSKKAFKEGIDEADKEEQKSLPSNNVSNMSDEELFAEAHRRSQQAKKSA